MSRLVAAASHGVPALYGGNRRAPESRLLFIEPVRPVHVLCKPLHPGSRIVPEIGDEHAGGEVVQPPAFRSPVKDTSAFREDCLRWCERPQGLRLDSTNGRSL